MIFDLNTNAKYLKVAHDYEPPPIEAESTAMSAQDCVQTIKDQWKNGKFNFDELKDQAQSTDNPDLKNAIDQLLSRPDWQYLLDGNNDDDVDDYVSKQDMNRFLSHVKKDESNHLIEANNNFNNFKQGDANDCFFLAAIVALKNTDEGKKRLAQMIKPVAMDGREAGYEVTFPGDVSHKKYIISHDDAIQSKDFSSGDLSTRVLEMAANAYAKDHPQSIGEGDSIRNRGRTACAATLLTGHNAIGIGKHKVKQTLLAEADNKAISLNANVNIADDGSLSKDGKRRHSVTVSAVNVDAKTVTYINPYDSTKPVTVPLDDFLGYCNDLTKVQYGTS